MNISKVLPITFAKVESDFRGDLALYDVIFHEDFGPFRKNEQLKYLFLSLQDGYLREYNDDNNVVREAKVRHIAKESTRNLVFKHIPEGNAVAFAEGVLATLDQLGYTCECDESTPPDEKREVGYSVIDVRLLPPSFRKAILNAQQTKKLKEMFSGDTTTFC